MLSRTNPLSGANPINHCANYAQLLKTLCINVYATVDFIYVKDLANGIALAAHTSPLRHQVYNLGSGTLTTVKDVKNALRNLFPGNYHEPRQFDSRAAADGHRAGAHGVGFQSGP